MYICFLDKDGVHSILFEDIDRFNGEVNLPPSVRDAAPTSLLVGTMKSSLKGILRSVCSKTIFVAYVVGEGNVCWVLECSANLSVNLSYAMVQGVPR